MLCYHNVPMQTYDPHTYAYPYRLLKTDIVDGGKKNSHDFTLAGFGTMF